MNLTDLMEDPFAKKLLLGLTAMLARDIQNRASTMTAEELYANLEFIPVYNPEKHDYNGKPVGYVCRSEDDTILQLVGSSDYAATDLDGEKKILWKHVWSKDPANARPFVASDVSPYMMGDCCLYEGRVYRCLNNGVTGSPEDTPEAWGEV